MRDILSSLHPEPTKRVDALMSSDYGRWSDVNLPICGQTHVQLPQAFKHLVGIGTKQKSVMVLTNSQLLDLVLETNSFTAF